MKRTHLAPVETQPDETGTESITILDTPVHKITMAETLAQVQRFMLEPRLHQIVTTNPEFVMAAQRDVTFRLVLREADLCIPDGTGLIWASRWLRNPLPERVPGSELVHHLARLAALEGWRLFLLGAAPGVAEAAAAIFQAGNPGLVIAGTYAGTPDPAENEAIVRRINDSQASILLVAYGAPRQDQWIARNRNALVTVRVAMGVGGALDFVVGHLSRAPRWMQDSGLEWLYRLYQEPWRWRRMLALPRFALKTILSGR
jgi:N-acetylglucosaminyldiphosphoundecaprenol N-acetyl-beta-D-mannosaminyltransferase